MGQFIQEFKKFAMRGNVIDMAVGIIIGGAFGKIVSSIVNDLVMPSIGLVIGGVNFKDLKSFPRRFPSTMEIFFKQRSTFLSSLLRYLCW